MEICPKCRHRLEMKSSQTEPTADDRYCAVVVLTCTNQQCDNCHKEIEMVRLPFDR